MVTTFYPPYHFGGDATYVRALSRELVARGHEVEVAHCRDAYNALERSSPSTESPDDGGVVVHGITSPFGILSPLVTQQTGHPALKYRTLRKILSGHFDVVNFHNISLIGGPAVLGLSRAPVTLYTLHEHWLLCPTHIFWKNRSRPCDGKQCLRCSLRSGIPPQLWRYTGLVKRSLAHVDALLAPSDYTATRHREAGLGLDVQVLPLFSSLDPGEPEDFDPPPRPRFVFAGRVTASKGVVPLLNTFRGLPDLDLQVIGSGDLLTRLRQEFAGCDNIRFTGPLPQDHLVRFLKNATALVLPSLAPETFGLAVVEAFACATPAIVRDAGGGRELVDATGAGYVYSTDDELAACARRLASDAQLRAKLGTKARRGFTRLFTADCHVDGYLAHISELQRKNRARAPSP
jgi:glycosyltransferase involved in cell wall biosynthesis